jgi:hypothetical protein
VPYERISAHLKRAIIAAEDAKFVEHEGFDWEGIQKAMEKNQKKGRTVAGGSTISQQLAKNLFLAGTKSLFPQGRGGHHHADAGGGVDKRRIFEVYLNVIEWGNGVFGAEAAARHYYNIQCRPARPEQAARLAGMVPNPRYYDRLPNSLPRPCARCRPARPPQAGRGSGASPGDAAPRAGRGSLVHKQHIAELQKPSSTDAPGRRRLHPRGAAARRAPVVWELVKAERDGEILLEVSDAVRETPHRGDGPEELVAAAEQLDTDELADLAPDLPRKRSSRTSSSGSRRKSASSCAPRCPTRRIRSAR